MVNAQVTFLRLNSLGGNSEVLSEMCIVLNVHNGIFWKLVHGGNLVNIEGCLVPHASLYGKQ